MSAENVLLTFVALVAISLGALIALPVEGLQATAVVFAGLLLIGLSLVLVSRPRVGLFIALFALPLTQAPTLKVAGRLRVTEVVACLLLPWALTVGGDRIRAAPRLVRMAVKALQAYIVYSAAIGIVNALLRSELSLSPNVAYFGSPIWRVVLESLRMVVVFSVVAGLFAVVQRWEDGIKAMRAFVLGGTLSALYAIYQTLGGLAGLPVLLLPGSSSQAGLRPFSTFYEPTALGSYMAVALILAGFLVVHDGRKRPVWVFSGAILFIALVASASLTGMVALLAGLVTLAIHSRRRLLLLVIGVTIVLGMTFVGLTYFRTVFGPEQTSVSFGELRFQQGLTNRVEFYSSGLQNWRSYLLGLGQGNSLFAAGGQPGWVRLGMEGGILGLFLVGLIHGAGLVGSSRLARTSRGRQRDLGAVLFAAAAATVVVTLNYINTTDVWLWVPAFLPLTFFALLNKQDEAEGLEHGR